MRASRHLPEPGEIVARSLDRMPRRQVEWLFYPFVPLRKITAVVGDGEVGKSTVMYDVLARVTTGEPMPRFDGKRGRVVRAGDVIVLTKEDDAGDFIRPRLEAAGADIRRVHVVGVQRSRHQNDFEVIERLDNAYEHLEREVRNIKRVRAILIDPVTDFFGDLSLYREDQIRKFYAPLNRMASKYNLAIISVIHMVKDKTRKARQRAMGGAGLMNVARAVNFVVKNEADGQRYVVLEKKNMLPYGHPNAASFTLADHDGFPRVTWGAEWEQVDLDKMLKGESTHTSKQEEAANLLRQKLRNGPVPASEIEALMAETSISENTFKAAKAALRIASFRRKEGWWWKLPPQRQERER